MKLIEQMRLYDGGCDFDISDNTFESIYVALCCETSEDKCSDDYDRFCYWLASNLEIVKAVKQQYGTLMICDVYGLIDKHYDTFVAFTKERNHKLYLMERDDRDDNIEIAMKTIESMIPGNYAEEDYSYFMELLRKEG